MTCCVQRPLMATQVEKKNQKLGLSIFYPASKKFLISFFSAYCFALDALFSSLPHTLLSRLTFTQSVSNFHLGKNAKKMRLFPSSPKIINNIKTKGPGKEAEQVFDICTYSTNSIFNFSFTDSNSQNRAENRLDTRLIFFFYPGRFDLQK